MLELYQAQDRVEAQMLKDYLQQEGIATVILCDHLSGAAGGVPANIFPTLWLLEHQDLSKAKQLIREYFSHLSMTGEPWRCEVCGENVDAGFEVCWNCATPGPNHSE